MGKQTVALTGDGNPFPLISRFQSSLCWGQLNVDEHYCGTEFAWRQRGWQRQRACRRCSELLLGRRSSPQSTRVWCVESHRVNSRVMLCHVAFSEVTRVLAPSLFGGTVNRVACLNGVYCRPCCASEASWFRLGGRRQDFVFAASSIRNGAQNYQGKPALGISRALRNLTHRGF